MIFTTNTKPLSDALDLGIINSNVSAFHKKSNIVQVTATRDLLRVNIEASLLCTEIKLRGKGDEDGPVTTFVSSLVFKQLVGTLESPTVDLEFVSGGLVIHSGKSKFNLPQIVDAQELELSAPKDVDDGALSIPVETSDWKFIKDNQFYALAVSFIHPVYTRVWLGDSGDVLVGDFDNSLFTCSKHSKLGRTCLVSDTIVNLFNTLPEGSKLQECGDDYIVSYESDSFSYKTQFSPLYESDENVGSYNSEIILGMMNHTEDFIVVKASAINKFLSQSELLASANDDTITLVIEDGTFKLFDRNIDCVIPIEKSLSRKVEITFKSKFLKQVISNYGDSDIHITPMIQEDEVVGIQVWDDSLTTVIAGIE